MGWVGHVHRLAVAPIHDGYRSNGFFAEPGQFHWIRPDAACRHEAHLAAFARARKLLVACAHFAQQEDSSQYRLKCFALDGPSIEYR